MTSNKKQRCGTSGLLQASGITTSSAAALLVTIAAVVMTGSRWAVADAFTIVPLIPSGIRATGSRPGTASAQAPSAGRTQSTTLYNGQFISGPGDQRAPGFTGFQSSGPRGGGGGGGGVSDEDAWFQEQVRQAQEQGQGGGGSSRDRVFVDMGELEEKQRREEERRMRMEDEAQMPMPGGGGGQSFPGAAGSSPFAGDFAFQVREAAKDPRQRGAVTNKDGRVFVDMDELERQKERENEERMRREMEREKREIMEKEMRREASKGPGPGPRPPGGGPRERPGPMGGGPMGVATAAAAGLAAAMFQNDGPLPPPPGSRDVDDEDAGFGDNRDMMYQSGPPPPPSTQSSSISPNPLVPYAPPPTEPSDANIPSSSSTSPLSAPTGSKGGAVVKLDDKTKMTVDIISGKCDKISSAADVINSKSDGIQVCPYLYLFFSFFDWISFGHAHVPIMKPFQCFPLTILISFIPDLPVFIQHIL